MWRKIILISVLSLVMLFLAKCNPGAMKAKDRVDTVLRNITEGNKNMSREETAICMYYMNRIRLMGALFTKATDEFDQ